MASTEDVVAQILDLTEAEFFGAVQSVLAPRESRLLDMDFSGVAVNAPQQIVTDQHDKLPLIMATRSSGERGWEVSLADNCILVGTNLQDGTVHFANALVTEKELQSRGGRERPPKGPKPPGLALAGAQLTELDARGRLHIKWDTGTWALGVIYYDWASNAAVVELKGDEPAPPSPARPVSPAPDLQDASGLPSYRPMPKTPQPPESGVSFTCELSVEEYRQRLRVFGAFAVPFQHFHLPERKVVHQSGDRREENIAAVIPVTMALLAMDWEEPMPLDWAVPVYGDKLEVGAPARGCFAIDALATGSVHELAPGRYLCYILIDGQIFGPQTLQVPEAGE